MACWFDNNAGAPTWQPDGNKDAPWWVQTLAPNSGNIELLIVARTDHWKRKGADALLSVDSKIDAFETAGPALACTAS